MWDDKQFRAELESLGETEVKAILARGDQWANLDNRRRVAQDWLLSLAAARDAESLSRKEAREEDAISIAREANTIALAAAVSASDANDIARSARKIAWVAAIAAIVAAITAIKWR